MDTKSNMKSVYTIVDRNGKSYWLKLGVGFVNRDGSINLKLDATPTNGTLQVRDYEPREDRRGDGALEGGGLGGGGGGPLLSRPSAAKPGETLLG